jgi:hypothetical protein
VRCLLARWCAACWHAGALPAGTLPAGAHVAFDEGDTVKLSTENGDRVQLFSPGHRYFGLYRNQAARIVPLFEVDNLEEAHAELIRAGAEIIGEPEADGVWTWLTFRGPDGNLHSLGARRA